MSKTSAKNIFVTGIGTGVGKTIVSAILTEAIQGSYWKPIQTGSIEGRDSETVKALISSHLTVFNESICLKYPASPHEAALRENIAITLGKLKMPTSQTPLIIEGAGGILVPLNQKHTMLSLIKKTKAPVIVVSKNYLGSINHTLLTLAVLKSQKIPVLGIVICGAKHLQSEKIIEKLGKTPIIFRLPSFKTISPRLVKKWGAKWRMSRHFNFGKGDFRG